MFSADWASAISKFEISLDHDIDEHHQYHPGEVIRGEVVLNWRRPITVASIYVQLIGEASVAWDATTPSYSRLDKSVRHFCAKETYVQLEMDVMDRTWQGDAAQTSGNQSGTSVCLEFEQRVPVDFTLPANLPSSFIGKFGSVTYVLKAMLRENRNTGFNTIVTSEPFLIQRQLNPYDLTLFSATKVARTTKMLGLGGIFCCFPRKVDGIFSIDKTWYVPGEEISANVEILGNVGWAELKAVEVELIMRCSFHAMNSTRTSDQVICRTIEPVDTVIVSRLGHSWTNIRLPVPLYIPESRLDGCDIIDVEYKIDFLVELDGGNILDASVPIIVGSVEKNSLGPTSSNSGGSDHVTEPFEAMAASQVDVDIGDDVMERFRHPIAPGETRQNIIFDNDAYLDN